jgi:hypothetical protein
MTSKIIGTRQWVMLRAKFGWPKETVPFGKTLFHQPDGYRQDAPGFISMVYGIPLNAQNSWGGLSTVTLLTDGWLEEIDPRDLKRGDCIGYCGPGSVDGDGGVVVLFDGWFDNNPALRYAMTYEQMPDVQLGPVYRARPFDFRWHAYRLKGIVD